MAGAKTVWGSMYVGTRPAARIKDEAVVQEMFDILQRHGVAELDTAQSYATSEEFLGRMGAGSIFSIGTKTGGRHVPESMRNDELVKRAHESLRKLKVEKVGMSGGASFSTTAESIPRSTSSTSTARTRMCP